MIELCVCVSHVPLVCDDGGSVGGDVGRVVTLVAWRVPVVPVPSASRHLSSSLCGGSRFRTTLTQRTVYSFRHVQFCHNDE